MSNPDAFARFREAGRLMQELEDRLHADWGSVNDSELEVVARQLETAIPGLTGVDLGRALVFQGHVAYYRHLASLRRTQQVLVYDPEEEEDAVLREGREQARRGYALLKQYRDEVSLPWAEDLMRKLDDESG